MADLLEQTDDDAALNEALDLDEAAETSPPEEASTASPAPDDTADSAPIAPTAGDETPAPAPGPIPYDRHKAILDNAYAERDAALQRMQAFQEQWGWAQQYQPDELREAAIDREIRLRQQQAQQAEPPGPDRQDEQGQLYYSTEQAQAYATWKSAQDRAAWQAELEQRLGPIEQQTKAQQQVAQANELVMAFYEKPGFEDHLQEITDLIAEGNRRGQKIGLQAAYDHIVLPKLAATRKQVEADVRRALIASAKKPNVSDIDPSRVAAPSSKAAKDMDLGEALESALAAVDFGDAGAP